jgi:hypothetical protein
MGRGKFVGDFNIMFYSVWNIICISADVNAVF